MRWSVTSIASAGVKGVSGTLNPDGTKATGRA